MKGTALALGAAGVLVAAGGVYLLIAVRQGAPAFELGGAIAHRDVEAEAEPEPEPRPEVVVVEARPPRAVVPAPVVTPPAPPPPPPEPAPAPVFAPPPASSVVTTASGLQYEDEHVGTGPVPEKGKTCVVHYTGWLWVDGAKGTQVDSSRERNEPIRFDCGGGQVIKGWEEGLSSMRAGGLRTLTIPSSLGYGDSGSGGGVIPPSSTLRFELELVAVE